MAVASPPTDRARAVGGASLAVAIAAVMALTWHSWP
jgi:hypothetical protein